MIKRSCFREMGGTLHFHDPADLCPPLTIMASLFGTPPAERGLSVMWESPYKQIWSCEKRVGRKNGDFALALNSLSHLCQSDSVV